MTGFFITGTDTDVGKTLIACALIRALSARGLRVVGMKPVAAGGEVHDGAIVNTDVIALTAASNVQAPLELVNPYLFDEPVAPHIAAAKARVPIDIGRVEAAHRALAARADCVIVEGAGGFRVPLTQQLDMAHLATALALPVVIVVAMRLGCLNHALLTASAVRAAGLPIAGWVANHVDPHMRYADENVAALEERLDAPLVARVPHEKSPDAARIAHLIDVARMLDA